METVSWPTGVNRIILSNSSMGHGENAVVSDKTENGNETTRLSSSGCPDEWKVSMRFSNSRNDSFFKKYNETEFEVFVKWIKFRTQMGTIPFRFGKIGNSSDTAGAIYKIKSKGLPSYSFNGTEVNVSMTWVEAFDEFISVNFGEPSVDSISAYNGYVELWYSEAPSTTPKKSDFMKNGKSLFSYSHGNIKNEELIMEDFVYDGYKACIFYYPEFTNSGLYEIFLSLDSNKKLTDRFEV